MHRLNATIKRVIAEVEQSVQIHGDWQEYTPSDVKRVVEDEFFEYLGAYLNDQIEGDHGQIEELRDLAVVAIKGIIHLQRGTT